MKVKVTLHETESVTGAPYNIKVTVCHTAKLMLTAIHCLLYFTLQLNTMVKSMMVEQIGDVFTTKKRATHRALLNLDCSIIQLRLRTSLSISVNFFD